DMGFKSNTEAFFEAERNLFQPRPGFWSHVTVYTAAQYIPSHAVDYSIRGKFEREYSKAIDMFLAGKLEDRQVEIKILIKHQPTPEQKAIRSAKIAELKQSVLST
ncbi:MAG: hypothetical protein GY804_02775, partial [Alphaproteobacteria bacterium]|nr:hypothetical protein [Alphaproteobacteria bacterium]